jgi:hypothetical protein
MRKTNSYVEAVKMAIKNYEKFSKQIERYEPCESVMFGIVNRWRRYMVNDPDIRIMREI